MNVREAAAVTILALLVVCAALPADRVFRDDQLAWLIAGAGLSGVLVPVLLRRFPVVGVAVSVLALAGYSLLSVRITAASADVPGGTVALWLDALRNGVPRLLSALVPVEPQPDTVLVPVAVTWLTGMAAAALGIRPATGPPGPSGTAASRTGPAGPAMRRAAVDLRMLSLGYLPVLLLYAGALALAGPGVAPSPGHALLTATVALTGLALGRPSRDPAGREPSATAHSAPPRTGAASAAVTSIAAPAGAPDASHDPPGAGHGPPGAGHRPPGAGHRPPDADTGGTAWRVTGAAAPPVRGLRVTPGRRGSHTAGRYRVARLPRPARPRHGPVGTAALTCALTGLCVAVAAWGGPALAGAGRVRPVDPRHQPPPPVLDTLDENPLVRISGWSLDPQQRLLDAEIDAPASRGVLVRLAVLTEYDGVSWRTGATYRPAGQALPEPSDVAGQDGGGRLLRQRITVRGLGGHLLPAVATPRAVRGVRVAVAADTGALVSMRPLRPGTSYTVTSREPGSGSSDGGAREAGAGNGTVRGTRATTDDMLDAEVPAGAAAARYLALGSGVPDDLAALAHQVTDGQAAPYQRAVALESYLAGHYTLAGDAPSGHAYPNLRFFLLGDPAAGGQRGTSEQFAASFAVLARSLGLPTRVVVGFRGHGGRVSVRGGDALAWPEVLFTGTGWVPFDPLPRPDSRPGPVEREVRSRPVPPEPPVTASPAAPGSTPAASPSRRPRPAARRTGPPRPLVAGGVIVAGCAGGYLLIVPVLRWRLRRRRTGSGTAQQRITGCWDEVLDTLRAVGAPAGPHLSSTEVAAHAAGAGARLGRTRLPVPPLDALADQVNRVRYAPDAAGPPVTAACEAAVAYLREISRRLPWWRRALWWLDPRPLWHEPARWLDAVRRRRSGPVSGGGTARGPRSRASSRSVRR